MAGVKYKMNRFIKRGEQMKKKRIIVLSSVVLVVLIIILAFAAYLGDYYHADDASIAAFISQYDVKTENIGNITVFGTGEEKYGFIFYPGGKVEADAYIPLMCALSDKDVFSVLVEMPGNLAVLDINAADGISEKYPMIENWYIGGHSLGGSMAAAYLENNTDEYCGLVLLGSYSTADFSESNIRALSLYGSEDKVMNREKYEKYKKNLPKDTIEAEIEGACHAYFGMYGEQDGDGVPTIECEKQINVTANSIKEFILRGDTDAENN